MPMIDVYAPSDLLPPGTERQLGEKLTLAVLKAEGVKAPGRFHLENTAAFIHRMDPVALQTAASASARAVRVQIITPPGVLTRDGQKQLVRRRRPSGAADERPCSDDKTEGRREP